MKKEKLNIYNFNYFPFWSSYCSSLARSLSLSLSLSHTHTHTLKHFFYLKSFFLIVVLIPSFVLISFDSTLYLSLSVFCTKSRSRFLSLSLSNSLYLSPLLKLSASFFLNLSDYLVNLIKLYHSSSHTNNPSILGPWSWASGHRARLPLRISEFEYRLSQQFIIIKIVWKGRT